jgi:hypothetical protein
LNYEWDAKALLSLLLVGLPELEGSLQRRAHRSLLTRSHHCFLIPTARLEDTATPASASPVPGRTRPSAIEPACGQVSVPGRCAAHGDD